MIILAILGINVLVVLTIGLALCALIGFAYGMSWTGFLGDIGSGIAGMSDLIIVTLLAGGMLEIIRHNGGIEFIINGLTKGIKGRRGAELSIAGLVGLSNLCTANNTIARKSASIMDTFSCVVQGVIPYGAQLLMASSLVGIPATAIIPNLYYPFVLLLTACLSILLRFPKKYS